MRIQNIYQTYKTLIIKKNANLGIIIEVYIWLKNWVQFSAERLSC